MSSGLMKEIVGCVEAYEPEVIRSSLCSYVVSREIHKDGFRVALCGEGADELFCGYVPLELLFAESATLGIPVRGQCLAQMNRTNLQRVDRCSMKWQLEARTPFMDPSIIVYALSLDAKALVQEFDGVPRGKMPLRALYDLYPDQLPAEIRDRTKIPFNEGAGFDISQNNSPWRSYAEENVSDAHFQDGKRKFAGYSLTNKEEFLYLDMLSETMDVSRVPHLRMRTHLMVPNFSRIDQLKKVAVQ
jgi:asparagine synthase (glutamine-hydrolysing)